MAASRTGASCCRISATIPSRPQRTEVTWTDLVRGEETVDLASLSDPVLVREDGTFLYTLPSVVDDIDMGITHVIRGDDHVTNTGVQIALFKALGAEPPAFGHHNLLTTASGEGLSKRTGALSIAGLRESGIEPMALASLAVLVGTSENVEAVATMAELAKRFDLASTSKSASKFDPDDLDHAEPRAAPADAVCGRPRPARRLRHHRRAGRALLERGARQYREARRCRQLVAHRARWARHPAGVFREGHASSSGPRSTCCRPNRGMPAPGSSGRTRSRKRPGGAAACCSSRSGWRLPGSNSGPELADLLPLLGREGTLARRP